MSTQVYTLGGGGCKNSELAAAPDEETFYIEQKI